MRRETLALLLLGAGCSDFHLFGHRETEDTSPDTEDTGDNGDTGDTGDTDEDCPSGPVTIQWGIPSASGEPGCSDWTDSRCSGWGDSVARGREGGEDKVWLGTWAYGSSQSEPGKSEGLFLLSYSDWEVPVADSLEPRIISDESSYRMVLAATALTADAAYPGEGLWVYHRAARDDFDDNDLHLFVRPPKARTDVTECEAKIDDFSLGALTEPLWLSSGDIDGDGLDDLVTRDAEGTTTSLWLSPLSGTLDGEVDSNGTIEIAPDSVLQNLRYPVLADLDLDGHTDLLFSTYDDRFEDLDPQLAVVYGPLMDHEPIDVPDLSITSGVGDSQSGFLDSDYWGLPIVVPGDLTDDGRPDITPEYSPGSVAPTRAC